MPVLPASAAPAHHEPTRAVAEPGATAVFETTELSRVELTVHGLDTESGVRVNRAAAAVLAIEHRVVHRQDRPAAPPGDAAPPTPEEALVRAIFGEGVALTLPFLDEHGVAEPGAVVPRDTVVLFDARTRDKVRFTAEESGEVVDVARTIEDLPDGIAARVAVTLRAAGPLCPGDVLWESERRIGVVRAIDDDGEAEPRLYLGRAELARTPGPTAHVTRRLPTARQQMRGRASGEYDPVSQQPGSGEELRPAQLRDLAERGCLALFNDFAANKCDAISTRARAYEALVRGDAVDDAWTTRGDPAPASAAAPASAGGLFAFFDAPAAANEPSREALREAVALARACGLTLAVEGHALALAPLEDPAADSRGEVRDDLFAQRIFGPVRDYACECGALRRTKHRGEVCATCGVEVLPASVRRTRFGHIALPAPVTHPWLATAWRAVPVLPAGLRPDPASALNALYRRVLAEHSQSSVEALLADLFERLRATLAEQRPVRVDYSGCAVALLDPAVPDDRCVVPLAVLTEVARPMLYAMCESFGYSTTLKSSARALQNDRALRRALAARVVATRPVLLAGERSDALAAALADVGDDPVVRVGPALAARLGVDTGDPIVVHLPLAAGAVREAHWLVRIGGARPLRALADGGGWLRELAAAPREEFARRITALARDGAVDPCLWPPAAFLLGGYEIADAAGLTDPPEAPPFVPPESRREAPAAPEHPRLAMRVDELEFSVRTANALQGAQIETVRDLVQRSEADLLRMKQFGRQSLREVKEILAEMGLSLGMRL